MFMFRHTVKLCALIGVLAACSNPSPTALPTALPNNVSQQQPASDSAGYQVLLVGSVLTVGPNRFAIGILSGDTLVKKASLNLTFFDLTEGQKVAGTVPAVYREGPEGVVGMYTAEMNFPKAGSWGVAIVGKTADGKPIDQKIGFDVLASSTELAV